MSQCEVTEYNAEGTKVVGDRCENEGYKKYHGMLLCLEHYKAYVHAVQNSLIEGFGKVDE